MKFLSILVTTAALSGCVAPIKNYVAPGGSGLAWNTSCDSKVTREGNTFIFTDGPNTCKTNGKVTGTYSQRNEISSKAFPVTTKATYIFETNLKFISKYPRRGTIFQVHTGTNPGCAPPLMVQVDRGYFTLKSAYAKKFGDTIECLPTYIHSDASVFVADLMGDGKEHNFRTEVAFDGTAAFTVKVYLDDKLVVDGKFDPPIDDPDYIMPPRYYFKHGVYSAEVFDYELYSTDMRLSKK